MWDIGIQLMKPIFQCANIVEFGSGMTINKNVRSHDHARRYQCGNIHVIFNLNKTRTLFFKCI